MSATLSMIQITTSANACPLDEEVVDNFVPFHDADAFLDQEDSIDGLMANIAKSKGIVVTGENSFKVVDKEAYFADSYNRFLKKLEEMKKTSLPAYSSDSFVEYENARRELRFILDESMDLVLTEEYEALSFPDFIRKTTEGKTYYVIAIYSVE
jgi:hypothetical protein